MPCFTGAVSIIKLLMTNEWSISQSIKVLNDNIITLS